MTQYDQTTATLEVFTYKEGLLSSAAHDLKLRVGRFRVVVNDDGTSVTGTFDTTSISVVCARKDGHDAPDALPHMFHGEIEKNLQRDVLKPKTHPEARFTSTSVSADAIDGTLTLVGQSRPVRVTRHDTDTELVGRVRLDQRDFGIKPFSAMLGTLKVKPEVDIEIRLKR